MPKSDLVPPDPREIEEAERRRIAQELHDDVTQTLYSMVVLGEAWRRQIEAGDLQPALEHIDELAGMAGQALEDVRLLIHDLHPPDLTHEGLLGALQIRLKLMEQRSAVETRVLVTDDRGEPLSLPTLNGHPSLTAYRLAVRVEHGLFRIAQEALNNAVRHGQAQVVTVTFALNGEELSMRISDDGHGFDHQSTPFSSRSYGLQNMRARAIELGGHFEVITAPGEGTTIQITAVPLTEEV
ncbi:MAG: sensor histidine kinase [Chloroflexota bacterium]|jgi:signal transduction histidine kinase